MEISACQDLLYGYWQVLSLNLSLEGEGDRINVKLTLSEKE